MKMIKHLSAWAGLLFMAAPLIAGDNTGISVSASVVSGMDALKSVTNNRSGFTLGLAYEHMTAIEVPVRFELSSIYLPGRDRQGLKTSLNSVQLASEVFIKTPVEGLRFLTGLTLNRYSVSNSGETRDAQGNLVKAFPVDSVKGIKLGGRLGMEYALNERVSLNCIFQLTELGATAPEVASEEPSVAKGGSNPSWIQIGMRYRF